MFGLTKNSSFRKTIIPNPADIDREILIHHNGVMMFNAGTELYYYKDGVYQEINLCTSVGVNQSLASSIYHPKGIGDYIFFPHYVASGVRKLCYLNTETGEVLQVNSFGNLSTFDDNPRNLYAGDGYILFEANEGASGFGRLYSLPAGPSYDPANYSPNECGNPTGSAGNTNPLYYGTYGEWVYLTARTTSAAAPLKSFVTNGNLFYQVPETNPGGGDAPFIYPAEASYTDTNGALAFMVATNSSGFSKPHLIRDMATFLSTESCPSEIYAGASETPSAGYWHNEVVYFTALVNATDRKTFKWNTNTSTLTQLPETRPGASDAPIIWGVLNGVLYYTSTNSSGFSKSYKYDGATQTQLTETRSGASDVPLYIGAFDNSVYYLSNNSGGFKKVYRYNGTTVTAITNTNGSGASDATTTSGNFRVVDGEGVYMMLTVSGQGTGKLFKWDGTTLTQAPQVRTGANELSPTLNSVTTDTGVYYEASENNYSANYAKLSCWHWDGTTNTKLPAVPSFTSGIYLDLSSKWRTPFGGPAVTYKGALHWYDSGAGKILKWDGKTISVPMGNGTTGSSSLADNAFHLTVWNDYLVFSADNSAAWTKNWYWDGTTLTQITQTAASAADDRAVGTGGWNPDSAMVAFGNSLYWAGYNSSGFAKLYRWTGSGAPTVVSETRSGNHDSPTWLTTHGDSLYYVSNNSSGVTKLYRWNGTSRTQPTETMGSTVADNPTHLCSAGDSIYYSANLTTAGNTKLFRWNGTTRTQVSQTNSTGVADAPERMFAYGGHLYYESTNTSSVRKTYKFDGTSRTQLTQTNGPAGNDYFSHACIYNGKMYWTGNNTSSQGKVWSWDGTTRSQVSNINASGGDVPITYGSGDWDAPYLISTPKGLVFFAYDGTDYGIWVVDKYGTLRELTDLFPSGINDDAYWRGAVAFSSGIAFSGLTTEGVTLLT
jgi:hypothetical protein